MSNMKQMFEVCTLRDEKAGARYKNILGCAMW